MIATAHYRVKPGQKLNLNQIEPDDSCGLSKDHAQNLEDELEKRLSSLQERLYAEGRQALLVIFQAMDAGGKDGAIKRVFDHVNPQGVRVTSFKAPTALELSHDFLWRVHQQVPPKGYIGIFNRSHYEDVLVVRVNQLVPEAVWRARYDQINDFEALLHASGTRILKFYLHISKDEQKRRFEERLSDPSKHWKFSTGDLAVRKRWDDYMQAYEDALTRCSTQHAPWYVIPANKKWFRDLLVSQIIVETLEEMDPRFPDPEPGLDQIVIPD
ncbi:MAG: polyphosphate kinase 2 family protein [Anaerolinea sp.]|nr:polyphosphate kinase 2 family protein [Anaerolinea sp.]